MKNNYLYSLQGEKDFYAYLERLFTKVICKEKITVESSVEVDTGSATVSIVVNNILKFNPFKVEGYKLYDLALVNNGLQHAINLEKEHGLICKYVYENGNSILKFTAKRREQVPVSFIQNSTRKVEVGFLEKYLETDEVCNFLYVFKDYFGIELFLKKYLLNCILYGRGPSQNYIKYFSQVYTKDTFISNLKDGKDYIICDSSQVSEVTTRFAELGILKYYLETK